MHLLLYFQGRSKNQRNFWDIWGSEDTEAAAATTDDLFLEVRKANGEKFWKHIYYKFQFTLAHPCYLSSVGCIVHRWQIFQNLDARLTGFAKVADKLSNQIYYKND